MAKETAEQKLLKLIESTESKEEAQVQEQQPPASEEALQILDSVKGVNDTSLVMTSSLSRIIDALKDPALLWQMISSCGVKDLNKALLVGIVIVLIFFVSDFSKGMKLSGKKVHFAIPENVQTISDNLFPHLKELAEYIEIVSRRSIFHPFEKKVEEVETIIPEEVQALQRVSDKAKDLKLVGISWEDTPESAEAMIENTISGVTFFKKRGDMIQGIKIRYIYADGITIVYDNQEMEMRL